MHPGDDELDCERHGGRIGGGSAADHDLGLARLVGEGYGFGHMGDSAAFRGLEGGITAEHEREAAPEPAEHFLKSAAAQQEPLALGEAAEVLAICGNVPGNSSAAGDEAVLSDGGDEGDERPGGLAFHQDQNTADSPSCMSLMRLPSLRLRASATNLSLGSWRGSPLRGKVSKCMGTMMPA